MPNNFKKFTIQAKRGIKGEAFFETLLSEHSITHHVVGSKDLGIDFFCEWVFNDKPTGIFYAVQVKTFLKKYANPVRQRLDKRFDANDLDKFKIKDRHQHLKIDRNTFQYWKNLGMPVYVFVIVETPANNKQKSNLNCYYKRYTPYFAKGKGWGRARANYFTSFYKVSESSTFFAFANTKKRVRGFARDLYIDYVRSCYAKGHIMHLDPKKMGLNQFLKRENILFESLFIPDYKKQMCATFQKTKKFLKKVCS